MIEITMETIDDIKERILEEIQSDFPDWNAIEYFAKEAIWAEVFNRFGMEYTVLDWKMEK